MRASDQFTAKIEHLEAQRDTLLNGLYSILSYVQSSKFTFENSKVDASDIVARIFEIRSAYFDEACLPWGDCSDIILKAGRLVPGPKAKFAYGKSIKSDPFKYFDEGLRYR